jgi:DNA-binding transcriptional MerR regulator|tara:strand:- start:1196 stop:1648 length:453 start_codon:yes stop_codon:yes gene_type:complete
MKTVAEIARRFNVSADTIRHYTKLDLLSPDRDEANGYRRYGRADEERLRFILLAKSLGFSLKDIRGILDLASSGDTACPLVRQLIDQRLTVVRKEVMDAQTLLRRMESVSIRWSQLPDRAPSGESICHLIEGWDSTDFTDDNTTSSSEIE